MRFAAFGLIRVQSLQHLGCSAKCLGFRWVASLECRIAVIRHRDLGLGSQAIGCQAKIRSLAHAGPGALGGYRARVLKVAFLQSFAEIY